MAAPNRDTLLKETNEALLRIRDFNIEDLDRTKDLGTAVDFSGAIEPAKRLISLYRKLPPEIIEELPNNNINQIKSRAVSDFASLDRVLSFDIDEASPNKTPSQRATEIVNHLDGLYDATFSILHLWISYSAQRLTDFRALEDRARTTQQEIKDGAERIMKELNASKSEAESVLETIRNVAAEQGVSQMANYFRKEAEEHRAATEKWMGYIWKLVVGIFIYVVFILFLHKFPIFEDVKGFEAVQLIVSKTLGFAVLSFSLGVVTKNFFANRHNEIVNRHRQNALLTYQTLVDAAGDAANKDVVLTQAAHCIFSPVSSGFSRSSGSVETPATKSIIEMVSKGAAESLNK